jgi:Fic family protein
MSSLLSYLIQEKQTKLKGGLYHKTQINLAYNSNRIEGSCLTAEQTRYIFETRTIGFKEEEAVSIDDIIETSNHFLAFDYLLDTIDKPLDERRITRFHKILKTATADVQTAWLHLGKWKKLPNEIDGIETTKPENVEADMQKLNNWYNAVVDISFDTIIEYHYRFEKIHPFQNSNGKVGQLIMFRECLRNNIIPFILDERYKAFLLSWFARI